jgi:hypothetical protein
MAAPKGTALEIRAFKYLSEMLKSNGMEVSSYKGKKYHIRFPLKAKKDIDNFFHGYPISVSPSPESISGKYSTHVLTFTDDAGTGKPNKGDKLFWVNSHAGTQKGKRLFRTKDLAPEKFGVAGKRLSPAELLILVKKNIGKMDLPVPVKEWFVYITETVISSKGERIAIGDVDPDLDLPDLKTVSKDFGEILAAIWCINNLGYNKAFFPKAINEPFVDFYGVTGKKEMHPVSVKSGMGSTTTINNLADKILDKMSSKEWMAQWSRNEKTVIEVIADLAKPGAERGLIDAHRILDSNAIKSISKITKIPKNAITVPKLESWTRKHTIDQVRTILKPWYVEINHKPKEDTWSRIKNFGKWSGLVTSPIGYSLVDELNKSVFQNVLTKLVRTINLRQVNIDIIPGYIVVSTKKFKDSKFKFSYSSNAFDPGRNKFGFKTN